MRALAPICCVVLALGCVDPFPEIGAADEPNPQPTPEPIEPWDGGRPDRALVDRGPAEPEPAPQPAPMPAPRPEPEAPPELDAGLDGQPPGPPLDRGPPPPPIDMAPPRTVYRAVASGRHFSCGIRANDSRLLCWGENNHGQLDPPQQPATHFGLGYDHGCAWHADDATIRCWGRNDAGQASRETINWLGVERFIGGEQTTCGFLGGAFACGGTLSHLEVELRFASVAVSERHGCAHRNDRDAVVCWGDVAGGRGDKPAAMFFNRSTLVGSRSQICGINVLGGANCWPGEQPPIDLYARVFPSAGDHVCAIRSAGGATCWGPNARGQTNVPPGVAFTQLAGGRDHTCGLDAQGFIHCWGSNDHGQLEVP